MPVKRSKRFVHFSSLPLRGVLSNLPVPHQSSFKSRMPQAGLLGRWGLPP
jgi:hypothetical protein